MTAPENTLVGIEIEFAVLDDNGKPVAMCDMIPEHGKDNPINLGVCDYTRKPIWAHYDNVLLELTTGPVQLRTLHSSIFPLLRKAKQFIHTKYNQEYQVLLTPAIHFPELESPASREIGCNPSINVYRKSQLGPSNASAFEQGLRTCGFHINIDAPDDDDYRALLIRNLDRLLYKSLKEGLQLIPDVEGEVERRTVYGKPGEHRSYHLADGDLFEGVEYRVLSPQWLLGNRARQFVERALSATNEQKLLFQRTPDDVIINGINTLKFN